MSPTYAKYFMAPEHNSNPVLDVDLSGVGSARGSHRGRPSILASPVNCQAEARTDKVKTAALYHLSVCARVLQAPIFCIDPTPFSLLSARTRQILPAGLVTKLTILISPQCEHILCYTDGVLVEPQPATVM